MADLNGRRYSHLRPTAAPTQDAWGRVTIGCSLEPLRILRVVWRAVESAGGQGLVVTRREIPAATVDALVYDLEPGGEGAVRSVRELRSIRPDVPVWLYYPARAGMAAVAAEAGSLSNVWVTPQAATESQEADVLANVRHLISLVSHVRLECLVKMLIGRPGRMVEAWVENALEQLYHPGPGTPKVKEASAATGISAHAAEDACRRAGLPGPKHLLLHLSLVYLTFMSWSLGISTTAVGRRSGLASKDLARLRNTILGRCEQWHKLPSRDQFVLSVMALADACKTPLPVIQRVIARYVGDAAAG